MYLTLSPAETIFWGWQNDRYKAHQVSENTESIFPGGFACQGVLKKDPTVWLDGARQPQKY